MESFVMGLSERIVKCRKNAEITQKNLAEQMGISVVSLNRYEKAIRTPDSNVLRLIAQLTNCDVEWLLTGAENSDQNTNDIIKEKEIEIEMLKDDLIIQMKRNQVISDKNLALNDENIALTKQIAMLEEKLALGEEPLTKRKMG